MCARQQDAEEWRLEVIGMRHWRMTRNEARDNVLISRNVWERRW